MEEKEKMKVKGKAGKEKGHYNNMNFGQKYLNWWWILL